MKCSQCDKPAVHDYNGVALCVDHSYRLQQMADAALARNAAMLNYLGQQISRSTGGLIPPTQMAMPTPLPALPSEITLNHINVEGSNVGAINTGTVERIDTRITVLQGGDDDELARSLSEFTQAVLDSSELASEEKDEINELLEFVLAQTDLDHDQRQSSVVKRSFEGIGQVAAKVASLGALWDTLLPLIQHALENIG